MEAWAALAKGEFGNIVNDPSPRIGAFKNPTAIRSFRFVSLGGAQGKPYAGAAEIRLLVE